MNSLPLQEPTSSVGTTGANLFAWDQMGVRFVRNATASYPINFSICTLMIREERYGKMVESFTSKGFHSGNSEFIALDNRGENRFDGYSWLRRVLPEVRGKYILFCHDDIELLSDGYDDLVRCLDNLEAQDSKWTIAGNAGHVAGGIRTWNSSGARYLVSPGNHVDRAGLIPCEVESMDENFFVINRDRLVVGSLDLSGFHFYASDLALNSERAGGRAYVIPFEVLHDSWGNRDPSFYVLREMFRKKHRAYHPYRIYVTTTGVLWFGGMGVWKHVKNMILGNRDRGRVRSEHDYRRGSLWVRAKRKAIRIVTRRMS